jgi:hypothetical protein
MVNDCCRICPGLCPKNLFLALTTCGCNFAGAHQVANVLLQKLVVVVKLIVLFANGFNAVKDGKERIL